MPSEGLQPYTDESGEVVGGLFKVRGQRLACDLTGKVTWVYDDARGEYVEAEPGLTAALDPDSGEIGVFQAEPDDPLAERDARLGALEASLGIGDGYAAEPFEEEPYGPEAEAEAANAAVAESLNAQLEHEAQQRGVDFTRSELELVIPRVREQVERGEEPDAHRAIGELALENPGAFHDTETRQGSIDWQLQRLADGQRDARGQELGEPDPPRSGEAPNLDDRQERHAFLADRVDGLRGPLEAPETAAQ